VSLTPEQVQQRDQLVSELREAQLGVDRAVASYNNVLERAAQLRDAILKDTPRETEEDVEKMTDLQFQWDDADFYEVDVTEQFDHAKDLESLPVSE
jgi:hypothetical protein